MTQASAGGGRLWWGRSVGAAARAAVWRVGVVRTVDCPARRRLQVGLGLVWLLDAALQFQPFMFTAAFPVEVIAPSGQGSPGWVEHPVSWAASLMAGHIVVLNVVFALVQVAIGVGLLYRRTVRWALLVSMVWSLSVWWLGEGLGGMLAGAVSPLKGAPGAVLVYLVVAVLVWPSRDLDTRHRSVATAGALGSWGARLVWAALWVVLGLEAVAPANRSPSGLHDLVAGNAEGEPGWVASIDRWAGGLLQHRGTAVSITLAVLLTVVAVGVFVSWAVKPVLVLAVLLAAAIWVVGQNFGALATGQATDPNSGLPLALLAATFWPVATASRRNLTTPAEP